MRNEQNISGLRATYKINETQGDYHDTHCKHPTVHHEKNENYKNSYTPFVETKRRRLHQLHLVPSLFLSGLFGRGRKGVQ